MERGTNVDIDSRQEAIEFIDDLLRQEWYSEGELGRKSGKQRIAYCSHEA